MADTVLETADRHYEASLEGNDVRLVVADMDGTLLLDDHTVPDEFWGLLQRMRAAGVEFTPASGRQYATLAKLFERDSDGMSFIAENGTFVVRDGKEVSSLTLDAAFIERAIALLRGLIEAGHDLGVVLCGKKSAYIERGDDVFIAEARNYYEALTIVDDVLDTDDEYVKIAVYDFAEVETGAAAEVDELRESHRVVVSGHHWMDIMPPEANKGLAVRQLQERLGVTAAQTAVFGDFFNDVEMFAEAERSYAMAGAHPEVKDIAKHLAPSNQEQGVVTVVSALLDAQA